MLIKEVNKISASSLNHDIILQSFQKITIFVKDINSSNFSRNRPVVFAFCDPS